MQRQMPGLMGVALLACLAAVAATPAIAQPPTCHRTITADVVALDQVFFWNRLGAVNPAGMIFALRGDVEPIDPAAGLVPGNVQLRIDKRPRPLVLRMNVGDCLQIFFQNLLNPVPVDDEQPATRHASIHVNGLQLVNGIGDDGSNVGTNPSSLVPPGGTAVYTLFAEREGQHLLYSAGATTGGEGDGGQLNTGLFGAVNVEPAGAIWRRSQVTEADLALATTGTTPDGHPLIDYDAVYPPGHPRAGLPILNMLQGNEIVHSDLTAMIVGPLPDGSFPTGTYPPNPIYPDRDQPFREFTIIYHDEIIAVQAFPQFQDAVLQHTLHSVRDGFAINYGTGGIGAEILANRIGVGPMWNCTECKYEEFFLSSWTVGDPAMVVDVPANAPCTTAQLEAGLPCTPASGPKATEAFYPDDPSNVYHSYLRDHVKFRILHGGSKEHHIHHQHTHQWVYAPDSDESTYLDSQAIGPGAAFTLEMTYNSSGNRNQAVGDSIFHCHFYPHFAQGMWALWRVHDVFESGTPLDADGRPAPGSRALPDGEIAAGTPIPAVVPLPGLAMAPLPGAAVQIVGGQAQVSGTGNPGFPFFVPGIAGHRPPHPPLDTVDDGGLPRHVIAGGEAIHVETRLDFTKELESVEAIELPEAGAPVEQAAMNFHAQRLHPSFKPDGTPASFIANGLPAVPGAPYADPCIDDAGNAVGVPRIYKAADIQLDAVFNKAGWHFPQERIITLWDDVQPSFDGTRPPEPFFFRANTNDCISYFMVNLVPNVYELDDFQVRTPTDILGQHIHLVKFDVTSSDGAANGWNYEDGTFSPDEVRERQHAIRIHNGCIGDEITGGDPRDGTFECPIAQPHPFFGAGPGGKFLGAQTTVQRWFADDVLNLAGKDRTLRTVFTHDHFGPSTHQQAGLYAGLVIEPEGSTWRDPETGAIYGTRFDGGPTSWRADILTGPGGADSYREFLFEFQDFALAYEAGSHPALPYAGGPTFPLPWNGVARQPGEGFDNPAAAINPPAKEDAGLPFLLAKLDVCPGGVPLPCPEAVSADDPGTMVVNYRNEPIATRVFDPATGGQAAGAAGNLAAAFSSDVTRADPLMNVQPAFYPPLTPDVAPGDPFTPLLQGFQHDKVQIRILVGAHEEGHNFSVNGMKWKFEPSWENSGYRNSQMMGISEHFELEIPQLVKNFKQNSLDYLWAAGSSTDDLWNGLWGLFRVYKGHRLDLLNLPNNPNGGNDLAPGQRGLFNGVCPKNAPVRYFDVVAATAQQLLPGGTLVYNERVGPNGWGPLHDPTAILYVRAEDVDPYTGQLFPWVPVEPLVLRANAGDCLEVTVYNDLNGPLPTADGFSALPMLIENFNNNQLQTSKQVGLHPQLVFYDPSRSDGNNVGQNAQQTVGPGGAISYKWYAGDLFVRSDGIVDVTPIEFGATNLIPADRIKQTSKGLGGALIIEPQGSFWLEDSDNPYCGLPGQPRCSRASATVYKPDGSHFREFVLVTQDDVNLRCNGCGSDPLDPDAVPNIFDSDDPEDSGQKAFNYRTEPMWFRMGFAPDTPLSITRGFDFSNVLSNSQVGGDPETPLFLAQAGEEVRLRVVEPGGHSRNHVFAVHGHVWQHEPYVNGSTEIGDNPLSLVQGARMGHGPTNHFDAVLKHAGGAFGVTGDYLYRDFASFLFDGGLWGIMRVVP